MKKTMTPTGNPVHAADAADAVDAVEGTDVADVANVVDVAEATPCCASCESHAQDGQADGLVDGGVRKVFQPYNRIATWCTRFGLVLVVLAVLASWWGGVEPGGGGERVPQAVAHDVRVPTGFGIWLMLIVLATGLDAWVAYGGRVFSGRFLMRDHVGALPAWTLGDAGRVWLPILVVVAGYPAMQVYLNPVGRLILMMGVMGLLLPGYAWVLLRARGVGWAALGFRRSWWRGVVQGMTGWLILVPWMIALMFLVGWILPPLFERVGLQGDIEPQAASRALWSVRHMPFWLMVEIFVIVVGAAFWEEALFRGFLQGALKRYVDWQLSVVGTALVFAAIHMDCFRFIPLFFVGCMCGILRERTRSLWPAVTAHALNNLYFVVIVLLG